MAFYIAAKSRGQKDLFLNELETGWTDNPAEAYRAVSWDDVELKYKDLMSQVERHENFGWIAPEIIKAAFPTKSGTLCIVEEVMVSLTKRGVVLK